MEVAAARIARPRDVQLCVSAWNISAMFGARVASCRPPRKRSVSDDAPVDQGLVRIDAALQLVVGVAIAELEFKCSTPGLVLEQRQKHLAVDLVDRGFALGVVRREAHRVVVERILRL